MEVYHIAKFRTLLNSHVPVSCTIHHGDVLVATTGYSCKNAVALWHLHGCQRPIELSGHSTPITSLTFSTRDLHSSLLLCAASQYTVILWDVEQVVRAYRNGQDPAGLVISIEKDSASVQGVYFSIDCYYVLVCVGLEGLVYRIKDGKLDTTITGHTGLLTCAVFSPWQHDIIVTAAEDRTYMLWDIANSVLIYQSSIISAYPFLSVAIDPSTGHIILGSADGKLRVYDMTDSHRCLHEADLGMKVTKLRAERQLERELQKHAEKSAMVGVSRVVQSSVTLEEVQQSLLVEQGAAILSLHCHQRPAITNDDDKELMFIAPTASKLKLQKVLNSSTQVWLSMHHSLAVVNADTLDIIDYWDLQDPVLCTDDVEHTHCTVPISYSTSFCWDPVNAEMFCVSGAFAQGTVSVLSVKKAMECLSTEKRNFDQNGDHALSVNASVPLCADSPLRAELIPKVGRPAKKTPSSGLTAKRHLVHDQPLMFHGKIKSSGYTTQPRSKMFVPDTGQKSRPARKKSSNTLSKTAYPTDAGIPLALYHTTTLSAPINHISFSGDGQHLACGTVDKLAHVLTMPPSSSKSKAFTGHSGSVTSVKWSEDNQWLLTCSTEKMARVWNSEQKDPVLTIDTVKHNFIKKTEERDSANVPFNKEVTHAQFFYMDKFILLTSANILYLYKYNMDLGKVDEIKRYVSNNKYRLVKEFSVDQAQAITAMSAINSFFSYIVLLGCSNRSLQVYDMNVGRCVHVISEVHSRCPHSIEQNQGSKYTTLPSGAHDLFITSAVSDGIKLWDLRTCRCVNRYEAHAGSHHPLGVSFSPCGQYIASGSENKCAYLYDIRSTDIHKLTGHNEVVSDVAFHPVRPLLATASLSGDIKYFRPQ